MKKRKYSRLNFLRGSLSRKDLTLSVIKALPFLTGPILLGVPQKAEDLSHYLKNFLSFALFFGCASLLMNFLLKAHKRSYMAPKPGTASKYDRCAFYVKLFVLAWLLLSCLQSLRASTSMLVFYPIVALLMLKGLKWKLLLDGRFLGYFIATAVFVSGISYVSINLVGLTYILPTLIFSTAIALMVTAALIAHTLETNVSFQVVTKKTADNRSNGTKPAPITQLNRPIPLLKRYRITYSVFVLLAPSLIGFLAFIGELPRAYLLTLVCYFPASRLVADLKLKTTLTTLPHLLLRRSTGLCLFFVAMILLAGLL
ncbi:MAG: hypothetical protein GX589_01955 [Deltaproteobacteria bacterium]|nr:hypothetical protein [Deltaproteobacteria bacterium]